MQLIDEDCSDFDIACCEKFVQVCGLDIKNVDHYPLKIDNAYFLYAGVFSYFVKALN